MSKTKRREDVVNWRKAACSIGNGACVEAGGSPGTVVVRDTSNRGGGQLRFSAAAWREFIGRTKEA